jgi:hypothetical protein
MIILKSEVSLELKNQMFIFAHYFKYNVEERNTNCS